MTLWHTVPASPVCFVKIFEFIIFEAMSLASLALEKKVEISQETEYFQNYWMKNCEKHRHKNSIKIMINKKLHIKLLRHE